jgi:hypothetical protein
MSTEPVDPISLLPQEVNFINVVSGDILTFSLDFPEDNHASVHELFIGTAKSGAAGWKLTNGDGLVVNPFGGTYTIVDVTVPTTITETVTETGSILFWQYKVDSITQMYGRMEFDPGMSDPV